MPPAIVCQGVWKRFHRGERHDSLRDLIPALARRGLGGRSRAVAALGEGDFWAVQDVNFTVEPGRALGIIGPNGAGKSTMLKMLTRILRPTRGAMLLRGRVAAMIEVAGGFHGDLTGKENVFLQGALMGMRRRDISARLDSIVEFAGVGQFIDTQVKRYSSGMNARLGFAIAAHLDPDVLVIDEVLSVGDMAFQEKCLARMTEFKRSGVAIVFVSHNMQAVTDLCDEAIYLQSSVKAQGAVSDVIGAYFQSRRSEAPSVRYGVAIDRIRLTTGDGAPVTIAAAGTALTLEARYSIREAPAVPVFEVTVFRTGDNVIAYQGHYTAEQLGISNLAVGTVYVARFTLRANLTRGIYHFGLYVRDGVTDRLLGTKVPAAGLQVTETQSSRGIADLGVTVEVTEQSSTTPHAGGEGASPPVGSLQRVDGG